ncbi:uncharacterized protein LOC124667174 [Lolium rigidum]|uniref:uncharacterized protein LOC124667174 n=1 Tax=Lolium rigidum TaxID=89674 RepID=UPI001F5CE308|nr:uncharacterized protein LOC124667174 [Lolium rigidum]
MKLIRRSKKGHKGKKGSSAPLQSSGAVDGGASSNSRRVAPEDVLQVGTTTTGYASSRDEAFFEASPWLESDCEDDFFSVNGDATPARTFSTAASSQGTPCGPQVLPTLGAILKAEPLKPPAKIRLSDLLKEKQEAIDDVDDLSRAGSSVGGDEAGRCCIPQFARVVSHKERRQGK